MKKNIWFQRWKSCKGYIKTKTKFGTSKYVKKGHCFDVILLTKENELFVMQINVI